MASLGECLPPIRPADLRRGSGCLQNRLLLLQRQAPVSEAVQRPLDDPRLQRHPGCAAITVELSGHAQWPEGGVDTSGPDNDQDDLTGVLSREFPAPDAGAFDHGRKMQCGGTISVEPQFGEIQEKGLGGGDTPLDAGLANGHHLPENRFVGRLFLAPRRAAGRIAALSLSKLRTPRRFAVPRARFELSESV